MLLDSKPIDNLSVVSIRLYNLSDTDYEKIPVYIELIPYGDQIINVVAEEILGSNELPEGVEPIDSVSPSRMAGATRLGYTVLTSNRNREPVFLADYLILGDNLNDVRVEIQKKGVTTREFSYEHLWEKTGLDRVLDETWEFVVILIFLGSWLAITAGSVMVGAWFSKRLYLRWDKQLENEIQQIAASDDAKQRMGLSGSIDPKIIASKILEITQESRWSATPRWFRPLAGLPKPPSIQVQTKSSNKANQHGSK